MPNLAAGHWRDSAGNLTADMGENASGDPRTVEQNATLARIAMPNSSLVRPEFRGYLLAPDGSLSNDPTLLTIAADDFQRNEKQRYWAGVLAAGTDLAKPSGGYVIVLNQAGAPVQTLGVQPTKEVIAAIQATSTDKNVLALVGAVAADAPTQSQVNLDAVKRAMAEQAKEPNVNRQLPDVTAQGRTAQEKAPIALANSAGQPGWVKVDGPLPILMLKEPTEVTTLQGPPVKVTAGVAELSAAGTVAGKDVARSSNTQAAAVVGIGGLIAFLLFLL